MLEKIRNWLQIFRAHTAPAFVILMLGSYLIGGGKLFSLPAFAIFVFAILIHFWVSGHNSLMDSCIVSEIGSLSYDVLDKNKKNHPLIAGNIQLSTAHKIIHMGLVVILCFGMLFSLYGSGNTVLSLVFFIIFIVTGYAYNCGLSKVTVWKFLPSSICFTALCGYTYFIIANEPNELFFLMLIYVFLTGIFEIGVEGEQKDIETNQINLLRFLGTKTTKTKIFMSLSSKIWSWSIKLSNIAVGFYILWILDFNTISYLFFIFFAMLALVFAIMIIESKDWGRNKKLRFYGLEEVCTVYLLPSVLIPVIGLLEVIMLMLFGVVYFITLNKINWGTVFAPKV